MSASTREIIRVGSSRSSGARCGGQPSPRFVAFARRAGCMMSLGTLQVRQLGPLLYRFPRWPARSTECGLRPRENSIDASISFSGAIPSFHSAR